MSTFGIHRLGWLMARAGSSFDALRNMKAKEVIEETLSKVFKRHRLPVSLKAEVALFYFKGFSRRAVGEFLIVIVNFQLHTVH